MHWCHFNYKPICVILFERSVKGFLSLDKRMHQMLISAQCKSSYLSSKIDYIVYWQIFIDRYLWHMKYKLAVTSVVCSWCSLVQYIIVRTNNRNFASLTCILVLVLRQCGAFLIQRESPVCGALLYSVWRSECTATANRK